MPYRKIVCQSRSVSQLSQFEYNFKSLVFGRSCFTILNWIGRPFQQSQCKLTHHRKFFFTVRIPTPPAPSPAGRLVIIVGLGCLPSNIDIRRVWTVSRHFMTLLAYPITCKLLNFPFCLLFIVI